jgi:hypothetical protein
MIASIKSALKAPLRRAVDLTYQNRQLRKLAAPFSRLLPRSVFQRALAFAQRNQNRQIAISYPTGEVSENAKWILRALPRRASGPSITR